MKFRFDQFRTNRGGYARMLRIICQACGQFVCWYQKDGPRGPLRRMYVDRIIDVQGKAESRDFRCPNGHVLGVKIVYEKEQRPAYRMFVDAIRLRTVGRAL